MSDDKSFGEKVASAAVTVAIAVTGATQGAETKQYVQTERLAQKEIIEKSDRHTDNEIRSKR